MAVKGKTDTELIPLQDNINDYFNKNVLSFNSHAFIDRSKDKIGYEIPFIRIFYKFVEPKKSDVIFDDFENLSKRENVLTKKILGIKLTEDEEKILKEIMGE